MKSFTGWEDGRTDEREREERNGRASILTSVSASKDDLLYETSLGWKGGGWHNFSSMGGGGGGGSVARSLVGSFRLFLPNRSFVFEFRSASVVRPRMPACPRPRLVNLWISSSSARQRRMHMIVVPLLACSGGNRKPKLASPPFLPPSAGYLPILWSHYSER